MKKALRAAGVPVETLYFRTEGYSFYEQAHQHVIYNKLLAFLDRNIGSSGGSTAAVTTQHLGLPKQKTALKGIVFYLAFATSPHASSAATTAR